MTSPVPYIADIAGQEVTLVGSADLDSWTEQLRAEEEGAIDLPRQSGSQQPGPMFFARLGGRAQIYPFAAADWLLLNPGPRHPAIQRLADSRFTGREWRIRDQARHARSKTYARDAPVVRQPQ